MIFLKDYKYYYNKIIKHENKFIKIEKKDN